MRIDPQAFLRAAHKTAQSPILASIEGEWQGKRSIGNSGLLCLTHEALIFVEDRIMQPGPQHQIALRDISGWDQVETYRGIILKLDTADGVLKIGHMSEAEFPSFAAQLELLTGPAVPPRHAIESTAAPTDALQLQSVPMPGWDAPTFSTQTASSLLSDAEPMDTSRGLLQSEPLLEPQADEPPLVDEPLPVTDTPVSVVRIEPDTAPVAEAPAVAETPEVPEGMDLSSILTLPDHLSIRIQWKNESFVVSARDFIDGIRGGRFGKGTQFCLADSDGTLIGLAETVLYSTHRPIGQVARAAATELKKRGAGNYGRTFALIGGVAGFALFASLGWATAVTVSIILAMLGQAIGRRQGAD